MEELRLLVCNFTKSNTPPWVFFTFLYKWYQNTQNITNNHYDKKLNIDKLSKSAES